MFFGHKVLLFRALVHVLVGVWIDTDMLELSGRAILFEHRAGAIAVFDRNRALEHVVIVLQASVSPIAFPGLRCLAVSSNGAFRVDGHNDASSIGTFTAGESELSPLLRGEPDAFET